LGKWTSEPGAPDSANLHIAAQSRSESAELVPTRRIEGVGGDNRMFRKSTILLVPMALLVMAGCGKWPPIVKTKRDIERLPASQHSIRARGLADSDIPSLARLRELRTLDFAGGNAIEPARITDEGLAELAKLDLPN